MEERRMARESDSTYGVFPGKEWDRRSQDANSSTISVNSYNSSSIHSEKPDNYNNMRKNLILLSVSFFLILTSFHGVAILQSSINKANGSHSLAAMYISMLLSSLFFVNWLINKLSVKWSIFLGFFTYLIYILGQFYITHFGLIFTGILIGVGASIMWPGLSIYVTQVSRSMSLVAGADPVRFTGQMFSFVTAVVQLSYCSGSIISSSVLSSHMNETLVFSANATHSCGAHFCPEGLEAPTKLWTLPNKNDIYVLLGIYLVISLVAMFIVAIFLEPLSKYDDRPPPSNENGPLNNFDAIKNTFDLLFTKKMSLLYFIGMYAGFGHGYIVSDYSAAYIACALGINMIGYFVMSFGLFNAIGCLLLVALVKYKGRILIFFLASLLSLFGIILMFVWTHFSDVTSLLFVIPLVWGLADSVYQSQTKALVGIMFASKLEEGFTCLAILESTGFILNYLLQPMVCNESKLVMMIIFVILSFGLYFTLEFRFYRKATKEDEAPIVNNGDIQLTPNT